LADFNDIQPEHPTPPTGSATETADEHVQVKSPYAKTDFDGDPANLVRTPEAGSTSQPSPLYVVWEITLQCDLGCKHCGSRAGKVRPDELTTAECLDMVHQMADLGVKEVTLIGGEAYLRDDWHTIAKEITQSGMVCGMTTGGRNLTQERVDQAVDAGLRVISVSIDGLEDTHDAQRGVRGSWRAAVAASKRVAESPIRLATNTQINRLSMPELPAVADLLGELGSRAWQIQLTVAMGNAADRPEMLIQPHELLELFPLLVWIKQTKLIPNGVQLFPGNNIGYFGPYEQLLRYGGDQGAHWTGCSAGKWSLGIEADGKIKGCPSLPSTAWTGGNIRDMKLRDVVEHTKELNFLKNRTRDDLWGFCKTCYYGDVCKAGCTWTSFCLFGKSGNNPYCIHRAMTLEKQGLKEKVVKVEQAPGLPFDHGRFEIITEAMEESEPMPIVSILGIPIEKLKDLETDNPGVWSKEIVKERLAKS
jgi:radical SAM protein with 4Fe4S-binding SPASM domain